jgi:hypothetical protein
VDKLISAIHIGQRNGVSVSLVKGAKMPIIKISDYPIIGIRCDEIYYRLQYIFAAVCVVHSGKNRL